MSTARTEGQPWYREPWPWIVMAGPALVIVAGIGTAVIAWRTNDGLVSDDYYKQGLIINQTLKRDQRAQDLAITAALSFSPDHSIVRLVLSGATPVTKGLRLSLMHPTQAGRDQTVGFDAISPGTYEARLNAERSGTWRIQLEDREAGWRLVGAWRANSDKLELGVASPAREGK